MCCRGAGVACVGALWMRSAGRGGSEEEVEDVDEDEDKEELVVLRDVGCAAMPAGAALWAAAASPAATAGRMEGISLGCGTGGECLEGPGPDLAVRRADPVGSGGRGLRGAAGSAFGIQLGCDSAMLEGVRFGVRGGKQFAWAAFGGQGGWAWGFEGVCGGRVWFTGRVGCGLRRGALRGGCVWVAGCWGR